MKRAVLAVATIALFFLSAAHAATSSSGMVGYNDKGQLIDGNGALVLPPRPAGNCADGSKIQPCQDMCRVPGLCAAGETCVTTNCGVCSYVCQNKNPSPPPKPGSIFQNLANSAPKTDPRICPANKPARKDCPAKGVRCAKLPCMSGTVCVESNCGSCTASCMDKSYLTASYLATLPPAPAPAASSPAGNPFAALFGGSSGSASTAAPAVKCANGKPKAGVCLLSPCFLNNCGTGMKCVPDSCSCTKTCAKATAGKLKF